MPDLAGNAVPESVLRLAAQRNGSAFLEPHHVEAARIVTALFERSQMRQRVTMSYDATRTRGRGGSPVQAPLADSAADARRELNAMARHMAADCWGLLTDICLFHKGLQKIEAEREWPRRGAKLVLRIALEQLCSHFGLSSHAIGKEHGRVKSWLESRPRMFGDDPN